MSPPLHPCPPSGAVWRLPYSAALTTLTNSIYCSDYSGPQLLIVALLLKATLKIPCDDDDDDRRHHHPQHDDDVKVWLRLDTSAPLRAPMAIGWMFLSASSSSSEWLFVGVCRAMLLSTLWTVASLRLMLPVVSGSALQVAIGSSRHNTVAPNSVVGRFFVTGPTAWNSMPDYLRDPSLSDWLSKA